MKRVLVWWFGAFAIVIAVWHLSLSMRFVSPAAVAYPHEVALALPRLLTPSGGLADVVSTMTRSLLAFAISVPIGLTAGVLIFYSGNARYPAQFFVDFLRSIPATALVPFFLILYGVGDTTKIAVGVFSSGLVICLATVSGLCGRNTTRQTIARILKLTGVRRVCLVDIPEAAPQIFLGFRTGISLALILVVVSEMLIGSNRGIGKVIADMRYTDDMPRLYAAMVMAGIIGYLYNLALAASERWLLHWRGAP